MGVVKLSTAGILDYSKTSNFLSGNAPLSLSAFDLLETTTLSTSASTVTLTGLGAYSDYKHLQIRAVARSTRSDTDSYLYYRLNGDSGASYNSHRLVGTGASVQSSSYATYPNGILDTAGVPAATAPSNTFGASVIDLLDVFNSSKHTTAKILSGHSGSGYARIALGSGLWRNTASVTSITIVDVFGDLAQYSRFSLYGVK